MTTKELLFSLTEADFLGGSGEVRNIIETEAGKFAEIEVLSDGSVVATLKGKSDYTVMLEAHYDQIGFVVTEILDGGFIKVSNAGGIDPRFLPATRVRIYGKKVINGVFASVPPHLKKDGNSALELSAMSIDTGYKSGLADIVSVGDRVVFDRKPEMLSGDTLASQSLDDRAGCVAILGVLEILSKEKELPVTVKFVFADKEELGLRGSTTAAFQIAPDEAVAVDVSFGDMIGIPVAHSGKVGEGVMVCISPSLNKAVCDDLHTAAKKVGKCQTEVTGARTGTDADAIGISRGGVKSGLLSIPLRNMHTPCETLSISDVDSVRDTLVEFVKSHKGARA